MRQEEGRKLIKQLAGKVDVLVENFRPGVMEKWKLGPKVQIATSAAQCHVLAVVDAKPLYVCVSDEACLQKQCPACGSAVQA